MNLFDRKAKSFAAGGGIALILFLGMSFLAIVFNGDVELDFGGAVLLFLFGGLFGLGARLIYWKGYDAALSEDSEEEGQVKSKPPAKMDAFLSARPEYLGAPHDERERAFEGWQASKKREEW